MRASEMRSMSRTPWASSFFGIGSPPASGIPGARALELFAKRATGDGWLVEVQQATARELLHDGRHTASFVQLLHVEGAARPQVGDERRLARDAIEQVQR